MASESVRNFQNFLKLYNTGFRIWEITKETLNIQAMLVPIRKAPPPPGGRYAPHDLTNVWGDNPNQLRVGSGRPIVPPPLVTLPNLNQVHQPIFNAPIASLPSTVTPSPPAIAVKQNRSGRRTQVPGYAAPKPPESKALNPASRQPGDSSSDENTLTSPDIPPPVPPHRDLTKVTNTLPTKKEKPKLPVKPPVASKPVNTNINVKNLAAKFDAKTSSINLE